MTEAYRVLGRPTTGVGTPDVLSYTPPPPLHSFLQLFRHLFLPLAVPVVVSQNPVTPGRVHPETDDKVHPAAPTYPLPLLLSQSLSPSLSPFFFSISHTRIRDAVYAPRYLYKKTDEGRCRRPLKKRERERQGQ